MEELGELRRAGRHIVLSAIRGEFTSPPSCRLNPETGQFSLGSARSDQTGQDLTRSSVFYSFPLLSFPPLTLLASLFRPLPPPLVAQTILNKYRDDHLCFNDDIQGTGATTLAGVLSALRARGDGDGGGGGGAPTSNLGDERIVVAGAGSAGIGVATVLMQAMMERGRTEEEARDAFYVVDQNG